MIKKQTTLLLLLISTFVLAQKPIFTTAKVKSATVYFNAAELSQTATATLPAGASEIVIKNVAVNLNENSVQIGAPSGVTVLSVQFTNNYISEYETDSKSPALKIVRDSIVLVQKEIQKVNNTINSENKTIQLLDKNQQISGVNSGLNVTELMKMVDYYKNKQIEIANNINTLSDKQQKLNELLYKLQSKLEINANKEEKTSSGKLIVQVMNEVAGIVPLDISYLTNNASWTPFYDLRAESVTAPINMMYKAQVVQNTGIDWKKVKLTLSSGMPNQNNQAPILSSWFLRDNSFAQNGYGSQRNKMNQLQGRVAGLAVESNELKEVVVTAPVIKKSSVSSYTTVEENQLNVSFDIDIPYDILSNGKVHSVSLKEIKLPASYKYYAAPRVENEAFLLAEIADYSKYNLLRGEANIIFEGMYVGKTFIEPNQTSDTLNLSMGRDKKVSIKREKVADKSGTKFLSAKKEQTFTFDITVRNNKKEAVELLLKDQYPLSTNKEIEVELLQSDGAKVNTETGILTWQLQLKPNENKKFRISYKVRYPKDQNLNL
ncbi:DUF4139 domain-containing protein [Flavobacterium piscisymbiosum]|uniref:DUF4139 domain-containing protein n=1 Tax=Flavobacterium piscisymbiosum TaxID=2893753 RepID=A0ABS8M9R7_9FLAO|nr:DUF4139 domain-containing protein [Flavobacterium sp. F-30]MCC9062262.1 DUF4139 domain-containing protein [Flavobacterium sp. F-30]